MLVSEEKDHVSQSLITSSRLEEVWLTYNADAHCTLGKACRKWEHVMCVCVFFFCSGMFTKVVCVSILA